MSKGCTNHNVVSTMNNDIVNQPHRFYKLNILTFRKRYAIDDIIRYQNSEVERITRVAAACRNSSRVMRLYNTRCSFSKKFLPGFWRQKIFPKFPVYYDPKNLANLQKLSGTNMKYRLPCCMVMYVFKWDTIACNTFRNALKWK